MSRPIPRRANTRSAGLLASIESLWRLRYSQPAVSPDDEPWYSRAALYFLSRPVPRVEYPMEISQCLFESQYLGFHMS